MSTPPTIEYHPEPLVGTVTVQEGPGGIVITVRPSVRRILTSLSGTFGSVFVGIFILAIIEWTDWTSRSSMFRSMFFVVAGMGVVAMWGVMRIWPILLPQTFEVTAENLECRWRKMTEAQSFIMPRSQIVGVRADRVKVKQRMFKVFGLVVHHRERGDLFILRGAPVEIEIVSDRLRRALGLQNVLPAGLALKKPAGCRYRRIKWRDGVHVLIRPRGEKLIGAALAIVVAAGVWWGVRWMNAHLDDGAGAGPWVANGARWTLGLILGAAIWGGLLAILRKIRRQVVLAADSGMLFAIETGLFRPLNLHWKHAEYSVNVVRDEEREGRGCIVITPQRGGELRMLTGEKVAGLRWLVDVLAAAARASTVNAQAEKAEAG